MLADINKDLMDFYRVLAKRPAALDRAVRMHAADGSDFYSMRASDPRKLSATAAAARFFYLNRFCFNGVYRTNKNGQFNVPRGSRTGALPSLDQLKSASMMLRGATFASSDFEITLDATVPGDFVYVDPPYFTRKGIKPGEYGYNSMTGTSDLIRLVTALQKLSKRGVKYLLSYSESRTLMRLLEPMWSTRILVRRSVGGHELKRKLSREVVVANYVPQTSTSLHG